MGRHPRVACRCRLARCGAAFDEPDVILEGALALRLGPGVGERGVSGGGDVPELVQEVHDLVVAEEELHAAAGALRLVLEPHEEVERLAHLGPAVEDVAGLHEDRVAAGPPQLGVDEPRRLQDFDEGLERAVDVPDRDHSRRRRRLRDRDRRPEASHEERCRGGDGEAHEATPMADRKARRRSRNGSSRDHTAWSKRDSMPAIPGRPEQGTGSPATAGYESLRPGPDSNHI